MHDVGARVRLARRQPPLVVDLGGELGALAQLALEHAHLVDDQALDRALDVEHLGAAAVPGEDAGVGDLTAGLGVERRPVQDDPGDLARRRRPRRSLVLGDVGDQREHPRVGAQGVVGLPVGRAVLGQQPPVGQDVDRAGPLGAGVGAGAVALLLHQLAEALLVDGHALLGGHLEGDVDREAVGVVQRERLVARQRRGAGLLRLRDGGVEQRRPGASVRRNASSSA